MATPLHLVVFDMDGTLIDSQDVIKGAMRRAFGQAGLPAPSDTAILSIVGLSLPEAVQRLAPDLDGATVARTVDLYRQSFIDLRAMHGEGASSPLYAGARAALERLAAVDHMLMGVATGKARRGLDHALSCHELGGYFATLQTADDHPSKPNPSMLMQCLRDTGVDAGRAVMVGDTTFDIAMGRAAGFATVGVDWGYHPAEALRQAGADVLISRFDQLPQALHHVWRDI
jgi:phosphoglycolate phosphatase